MSTRANSIEVAPALSSAVRVQNAEVPVEVFTLACVDWYEDPDFTSEFGFISSLPARPNVSGDLLELVSYLILGLCGLSIIGLCFF